MASQEYVAVQKRAPLEHESSARSMLRKKKDLKVGWNYHITYHLPLFGILSTGLLERTRSSRPATVELADFVARDIITDIDPSPRNYTAFVIRMERCPSFIPRRNRTVDVGADHRHHTR